MKLNLGCSRNSLSGYVNVDIVPYTNVDVVWDVTNMTDFLHKEVEEVVAKDLIEHFNIEDVPAILAGWAGLLKPGGRLILEFPDALTHCKYFIEGLWSVRKFNYQFFSKREPGQKPGEDWNLHKCALTKGLITELLLPLHILPYEIKEFATPSTFNIRYVGIKSK